MVLAIAKVGIEAGLRGYSTPGEYSLNITFRLRMPDETNIKEFRQSRVLEVDDEDGMSTYLSMLKRIYFLETGHKVKWSFSPPLIDDSAFHRLVKERLNGLFSRREVEVIKAIAKGKLSKELAEEWRLSKHTIATHRRNILRKSGTKNTVELIGFAR